MKYQHHVSQNIRTREEWESMIEAVNEIMDIRKSFNELVNLGIFTPVKDENEPEIFVSSWGYDQTNVTFYKVLKRTAKTITLQRIESKEVATGFMCGESTPLPDQTFGGPIRRKIQINRDGKEYVSMTSYEVARPWDGKPRRCSWYA